MKHSIYKVESVRVVGRYILEIVFNDRLKKTINFETILNGEMYSPLRDLSLFNQVRIDPEVHTIVWPNGADFDPAILHDWEDHLEEISNRSHKWEVVEEKH